MAGSGRRAVKECPNCAVEIRQELQVCPVCRYEFGRRSALPAKRIVGGVVLVAFLLPAIWGLIRILTR
jgi:hypothetical protein